MENKTFVDNITDLSEIYGLKELTEKRISLYWKYLKEIDDDDFKAICERIILTERFFPSISVFKEVQAYIKNNENRLPEWM
jgi:hypothetical protein